MSLDLADVLSVGAEDDGYSAASAALQGAAREPTFGHYVADPASMVLQRCRSVISLRVKKGSHSSTPLSEAPLIGCHTSGSSVP